MSHKENTPDILFAGEKSFENPSAFFGYDRDDVFEKWPVKGASERIQELTKKTLKGEMFTTPVPVEFDRMDIFLSKQKMESKRVCDYILKQEPKITPYSRFTGFFRFDGTVVGDAFNVVGHTATERVMNLFYLKPVENLSTMEWQHATVEYRKVLAKGILGMIEEIDESLKVHEKPEEIEFLEALRSIAVTIIEWAKLCSEKVRIFAEKIEEENNRKNLLKLADALLRVPANKPQSFYEAVLTVYICFSADPDSVGTLDRYLNSFYEADIASGSLTRDEAKEYLQELFLMLQAATSPASPNFTRGGQSHFCIGGYLPNGEDGFTDLSHLILEALIELPTYIPEVTLRWTKKLAKEHFRFALDCERKDPNKRIAFQNDEPRIKCYTEIGGLSYEKAVSYTTVGCNEPAFPGTTSGSTSTANFARSMEILFHQRADTIRKAADFDEFYAAYEQVLFEEMDKIRAYDDMFNKERAKDISYISSLFFNGCIENARSLTQGGDRGNEPNLSGASLIGIPNVLDSLIVVKQFVFEENLLTMEELIDALEKNWEGYEDIRTVILKKGDFFGNDTARSNGIANRLYTSLYHHLTGVKNAFGYQWLVGDLIGYKPHHSYFGAAMEATPDGRKRGDSLKFGLGQGEGKDRNGLTALLNSVAKADPTGIGCGQTITNLMLDEQLVKNDESFEKTVDMLEAYFKNGGVHFQLNYVSAEDLKKAKVAPDAFKTMRVRVSGFSDYFVKLDDAIQDDIIERTSLK